ncbi:alpha/beta fold hydrolase [Mesorhizobium sp. CGMCC 1.15528]|uniref:Alpha/beta fold hydrolase n=1 Tax=Mesorhizobium zhangyense TaxID=1776730 RepID=A0A7C9VBI4_9HYPH|nr:alpha/beta fold hydrolase [Mesorhizobium zhangyense]NGN41132.1 alpha/beta fold hydrolase [Mesorhizobium zhangyense]
MGGPLIMEGTFVRDGVALNYRIDKADPAAPWLVFGNSLMTDLSIWDEQVAALASAWNILRYDQRGHGQSGVPVAALDIPTLAEDLLALIDFVGIERCTYVGLSMGVPTGLAAFGTRPELFERLVLVDGQARSAATGLAFWEERIAFAREHGMAALAEQTMKRWLRPKRYDSQQAERLQDMIAATQLEGFVACASALREYDQSAVLPQLDIPVRLIAGAEDGAMPATMKAIAGQIADAAFEALPDAGHVPNFEKPAEFNAALAAALR